MRRLRRRRRSERAACSPRLVRIRPRGCRCDGHGSLDGVRWIGPADFQYFVVRFRCKKTYFKASRSRALLFIDFFTV
eukprot:scaffold15638_cov84-Phaeocystis_antarctica.AAC.1